MMIWLGPASEAVMPLPVRVWLLIVQLGEEAEVRGGSDVMEMKLRATDSVTACRLIASVEFWREIWGETDSCADMRVPMMLKVVT